MCPSLKLLGHPADHLKKLVPLVAKLVFLIRVNRGKITDLQGLLLPCFVEVGYSVCLGMLTEKGAVRLQTTPCLR
jgi:hypothetical protein